MEKKNVTMAIDNENGIKYISLGNGEVKKTISISDDGVKFLGDLGADIVLDLDENNNLVGIELMGF